VDATKQALIERLAHAADRLAIKMRRSVIQESMQDWSELELTIPQLRTLGLLAHSSRRMGEVASCLGSSVSSATSLIERLEGKALVERVHDPVDRRVVICHLTPDGQELMERFWRLQRLKVEQVVDLLDEKDLTKVVTAVEIMADAFERSAQGSDVHVASDSACAVRPSIATAADPAIVP
jgi:DNA-binding MarR family transcriptional regulator